MLIWCNSCNVRMIKEDLGIDVKVSSDMVQTGDLFRCPNCGREVISDFGEPFNPKLLRKVKR